MQGKQVLSALVKWRKLCETLCLRLLLVAWCVIQCLTLALLGMALMFGMLWQAALGGEEWE